MKTITYVIGDATQPIRHPDERILLAHVVNDQGVWGRGFVMALTKRDRRPEREYRHWHASAALDRRSILGHVQVVPYQPRTRFDQNIWVANMCAQRGWRRGAGDPQALDEEALTHCLRDIARWVSNGEYTRVVMPRIGAGLGGASWPVIAKIIETELCERDVDVTVYSLPHETWEDPK